MFQSYFVYFDSCKINNLNNKNISELLGGFYANKRQYDIKVNEDSDILSLLLPFLDNIFEKNVLTIDIYLYDKLSETIDTLKNIRSLVINLKNKNYIPKVPYLHELISDNNLKTRTRI